MSLDLYSQILQNEIELLKAVYDKELSISFSAKDLTLVINLPIESIKNSVKNFINLQIGLTCDLNYPNTVPEIVFSNYWGLNDGDIDNLYRTTRLRLTNGILEPEGLIFNCLQEINDQIDDNIPRCRCSICLDNFDDPNDVYETVAHHYFHQRCIEIYAHNQMKEYHKAVTEARRNNQFIKEWELPQLNMKCPICRVEDLVFDSEPRDSSQRWLSQPEDDGRQYLNEEIISRMKSMSLRFQQQQKRVENLVNAVLDVNQEEQIIQSKGNQSKKKRPAGHRPYRGNNHSNWRRADDWYNMGYQHPYHSTIDNLRTVDGRYNGQSISHNRFNNQYRNNFTKSVNAPTTETTDLVTNIIEEDAKLRDDGHQSQKKPPVRHRGGSSHSNWRRNENQYDINSQYRHQNSAKVYHNRYVEDHPHQSTTEGRDSAQSIPHSRNNVTQYVNVPTTETNDLVTNTIEEDAKLRDDGHQSQKKPPVRHRGGGNHSNWRNENQYDMNSQYRYQNRAEVALNQRGDNLSHAYNQPHRSTADGIQNGRDNHEHIPYQRANNQYLNNNPNFGRAYF